MACRHVICCRQCRAAAARVRAGDVPCRAVTVAAALLISLIPPPTTV
jgi:hypothetical protein